jgi:hypothetical protein
VLLTVLITAAAALLWGAQRAVARRGVAP